MAVFGKLPVIRADSELRPRTKTLNGTRYN